jgi:metal-responsive CopG/Arc/MetJ family transcriptional regulator
MGNKRKSLANRQGFCVSVKLTLKEYTELEELVRARGTNRSAWIRELIQVNIAVQKNNNEAAQPPP